MYHFVIFIKFDIRSNISEINKIIATQFVFYYAHIYLIKKDKKILIQRFIRNIILNYLFIEYVCDLQMLSQVHTSLYFLLNSTYGTEESSPWATRFSFARIIHSGLSSTRSENATRSRLAI